MSSGLRGEVESLEWYRHCGDRDLAASRALVASMGIESKVQRIDPLQKQDPYRNFLKAGRASTVSLNKLQEKS